MEPEINSDPPRAAESAPQPRGRGLRVLEIETFGMGGLAHYVDHLARALAARGHEVTIVTNAHYELDQLLIEGGSRHDGGSTQLNSAGSNSPGSNSREHRVQIKRVFGQLTHRLKNLLPRWMLSLTRKLDTIADAVRAALIAWRTRADVVHFHCTNREALLYLALLKLARRPVLYTAHVVTPHEPVPLQGILYDWLYRLCNRVVVHSDFDRERLVDEFSLERGAIDVVPHGEYGFFAQMESAPGRAEARRQLNLGPEAEVVLFFGYLRKYKGFDVLLESWPAVKAARPAAQLLLVGEPARLSSAERSALDRKTQELGVHTRFDYVPINEVATYFRAADTLVLPYRRVSQSGVLYLGLALGLPVIATAIGAWREMLVDEENALLVGPEAPEALATAQVRLLSEPALCEQLRRGGLRLAEEHSWPAIAERTERVLEQLA